MRILLALVLAGCATPYPMTWARPGASDDDLRMEAAQCRVQAKVGSGAEREGTMALAMAHGIYRDCMIGKGWASRP